jgi:uncharacterized membrane protein
VTRASNPISGPISGIHGAEPLFAARLTAHRSLGRRGFLILMALLLAISLSASAAFLAIGAWPVFGFFGLDLLLIYLAFRLNYRDGRASEEVAIWRDDLVVRQISPAGRIVEHRFNPFWTRFGVDRHEEFGVMRMVLTSKGREVELGSFLNPVDRESFARAFSAALSAARAA